MTVHRLTETGGWVNGVPHHKTSKHDNGMAVPSGVRGVIMHTMVGNLAGTDDMFMNSARLASAHFGIGQDGSIIQWVSVRGGVAWHIADGNYHWYGIEHADNGDPGNPLTEAQLSASAQLAELLARSDVGRFPLQVSNSTGTEGYGVHYMGGTAWGGHSCPQRAGGSDPRAGQRAEIIRRATIIRRCGQYPAPDTAPEEEEEMAMLKTGYQAETIEVFRAKTYTSLFLGNDCDRTGAPAPKLRIAVHSPDGWGQVQTITLQPSNATWFTFKTENANMVSILRAGNNNGDNVEVAYKLY